MSYFCLPKPRRMAGLATRLAQGVGKAILLASRPPVPGASCRFSPRAPPRCMSSLKYFNIPLGTVSSADAGIRLDRWIVANCPVQVPEALFRKFVRSKKFRVKLAGRDAVEDAHAVGTSKLAAGTVVVTDKEVAEALTGAAVRLMAPTPATAPAGADTLEEPPPPPAKADPRLEMQARNLLRLVVHCDADIVALSKPAGLAVQGGTDVPVSLHDLLPYLARLLPPLPGAVGLPSLRLVHRLDRDVSGVLILARSRGAAERMAAAFKRDTEGGSSAPALYKQYVGLVARPKPTSVAESGVISQPVVHEEWASGGATPACTRTTVPASTAYRVAFSSPTLSVLLLWPASGRKHQLRQHVAWLYEGHGLVGDTKYGRGGGVPTGGDQEDERALSLHLSAVKIPAGTLGTHQLRDVAITDPLPPRMRDVIIKHGVPAPALSGIGAPQEPICCVPHQD